MKILFIAPAYACLTATEAGQRSKLIYIALKNIGIVDVVLVGKGCSPILKENFPDANSIYIVDYLKRAQDEAIARLRPVSPQVLDKLATVFGKRSIDYQRDPLVGDLVFDLNLN